jgi:HEAT repeat protein
MADRTESTKSSSVTAKLTVSHLETALKALAKLLVSIKFYPAGHPSLKGVTRDVMSGFVPLLQLHDSVVVVVRRSGFFYEDEPVGSTNTMLQKLAVSLFTRRIQRLTFLKDLSCQDLWEAAKILLLDAEVIQKKGGVQSLLQQARVTTIWTNVVDMSGIFELKKQLEVEKAALPDGGVLADEEFLATLGAPDAAESGETGSVLPTEFAPPAGELTFEELLKAVEMASDDQEYFSLLQRLIPVVQGNLTEKSAHLVLQTLTFLTHCCESSYIGDEKRKSARQAMAQLSSPALLNFYIDLLNEQKRFGENRFPWVKVTCTLGDPLAKLLLTRLAAEEDSATKKILYDALVSQGEVALAAILATLKDEHWPVLRNATQLLGEIRSPAAIEPLRALLQHPDLRVRREVLRALTRIGGNSVISIIARILQGKDTELRRQAMLCLGAIKNPATIPLLVHFLQIRDWRFRQLEAKLDAIKALGEIGSREVLPALMAVVKHRPLFYRSRNNLLRADALAAIGTIGGPEALRFLESMAGRSNPVIERAVVNALKHARKGLLYE